MINDGAFGGIPAVTKRKRVIGTKRKHGLHGRRGTKESNIISEKKTVKGGKGRG